jgi:DNA-binding NtrC family response regulator
MSEPSDIHVLILDDEKTIRSNLYYFLEDKGFEVSVCGSAERALEFLKDNIVDVAVVDIRLAEGGDGNQFMLGAHKLAPGIKFMICTGSIEYSIPKSLREIGVDESSLFYKPIIDLNYFAGRIIKLAGETFN